MSLRVKWSEKDWRDFQAALEAKRRQEQQTAATGPGWATFNIGALGVARAQDVGDGRSQLFLTGGRSVELNRAAVLLYAELVRRGFLAPPPPLETLSAG